MVDTLAEGRYGFDLWCDTMRPICDFQPLGEAAQFASRATGFLLEPFVFMDVTLDRTITSRTKEHLREQPNQMLLMNCVLSGSSRGLMDDTPVTRPVGSVDVLDLSVESTLVFKETRVLSVAFPRGLVDIESGRRPPYCSLAPGSLQGQMVASTLREIVGRLPTTPRAEAPAIAEGYAALLRGLLRTGSGEEERGSLQAAMRAAILSYIDRRLDDQGLNAVDLCRAFGMSRATLYRLFEEAGGVQAAIRKRRLARCLADLLRRRDGTPVREVAERYGFTHASHFTRCFKETFLLAPSDVKPQARGREASMMRDLAIGAGCERPFASWFREISRKSSVLPIAAEGRAGQRVEA